MRYLDKDVQIGDKTVGLRVNREICCKVCERHSEFTAIFFEMMQNGKKEGMLQIALRLKKLNIALDYRKYFSEFIEYAFELMVKEYNRANGIVKSHLSEEVIEYVKENNAVDIFNEVIFEVFSMGFTIDTEEETAQKPTIQIKLI